MEINEHPEPVWCGHGLEWTWDGEAQHFVSPHEGVPDADAGALPEECDPIFARLAATEKLDNATDAAGMVLDEDGYPCEHYPWIHIIDKTQIVTSVEDGRTKQGRGSW
jgi:hypothetical protein